MTKPVAIFCATTPMSIPLFGNRFHLLMEAGIDLHIVVGEAVTESIPELPTEATLHVVPMTRSINPLGDITALAKMVKLQRRLRPKLVAAATPKASLIGLLAARLNRVPVRVWEVWGAKWDRDASRKGSLLRRIDRIVAHSATEIIAVSPSLAELLVLKDITACTPQVLGAGSSKGVDTDRFHPDPSRHPCTPPTIGFVGRISKDKGIEDVYNVADALRRQVPDLQLILVGDVDKSNPPSQEVVDSIHTSDWIEMTGWVPDTSPHYRGMDVLVFPSRREGLPNAILEAAASGVPVVAYSATGSVDALLQNGSGYYVDVGNSKQMMDHILRILMSPQEHSYLSTKARDFVMSRFKNSQVEDRWTNLYCSSIGQEPASGDSGPAA